MERRYIKEKDTIYGTKGLGYYDDGGNLKGHSELGK